MKCSRLTYRVVEQASGKSYVLEELDGTRMARRFAAAHIKRFYAWGDRSREEEEEEEEDLPGILVRGGVREFGRCFGTGQLRAGLGFWAGFLVVEPGLRRSGRVSEAELGLRSRTGFSEVGPGYTGAEPGFRRLDRVGPGRVIPEGGQNMTPGEIFPGVQKSGQIFDSCPGSGTMQGVLDWIRAGLSEDRGHKKDGYGWSGGMSWRGDRWQWRKEEAGGGCGRRNGKGGQGRGGAESAPGVLRVVFWWSLQDFEEEGVTVEGNGWHHWKEGQKLGGGAHQGQSGWSKTTGATDL
ncbi:hypothetical protein BY996DRAFT_6589994 [Phakopsora pachyrhizi]|nr:hypothetical protein BY996DRAFT_6589994 [Phakopsora pachyrhizi]